MPGELGEKASTQCPCANDRARGATSGARLLMTVLLCVAGEARASSPD